jgi:uncharacterized protein involved in exopolysaccharide biosynthesis
MDLHGGEVVTPVLDASSDSAAELLRRLARSRRLVLLASLAGLLLAVALALVLPRTYVSEATLLPSPEEKSGLDPDLLGIAGNLGITLPATSVPESRLYPAILKSERLLRTALAMPLGSSTLFERVTGESSSTPRRLEEAVDFMRRRMIRVAFDEETGIVRVVVRFDDPQAAQRTGEILLEGLAEYLRTERASQSHENRAFVESRRDEASTDLAEAEQELGRFREANRRIAGSPELQLEEARLERSVRLHEEIFLELSRQFEIARIEEQKATSLLEVLDPPTPRWKPVFPNLSIFAGMGLLVGAFLGALLAVFVEEPASATRTLAQTWRAWRGKGA